MVLWLDSCSVSQTGPHPSWSTALFSPVVGTFSILKSTSQDKLDSASCPGRDLTSPLLPWSFLPNGDSIVLAEAGLKVQCLLCNSGRTAAYLNKSVISAGLGYREDLAEGPGHCLPLGALFTWPAALNISHCLWKERFRSGVTLCQLTGNACGIIKNGFCSWVWDVTQPPTSPAMCVDACPLGQLSCNTCQ